MENAKSLGGDIFLWWMLWTAKAWHTKQIYSNVQYSYPKSQLNAYKCTFVLSKCCILVPCLIHFTSIWAKCTISGLYILILATSVLFIVFIADGSPESRLNVKFVQDTSKFWYKPEISRDQGEKTFVFTDLYSNWSDACPFFFSLCVWPKWVGFSLSFWCCHEQ